MTLYVYKTEQNYKDKPILDLRCYDYDKSFSCIYFESVKIFKSELGYNFFGEVQKNNISEFKDKDNLLSDSNSNYVNLLIHDKDYEQLDYRTKEKKTRTQDTTEKAICTYLESNSIDLSKIYFLVLEFDKSIYNLYLDSFSNNSFKQIVASKFKAKFTLKLHEDQSLYSDFDPKITEKKAYNNQKKSFSSEYDRLKDKEKFVVETINQIMTSNYSTLGEIYQLIYFQEGNESLAQITSDVLKSLR